MEISMYDKLLQLPLFQGLSKDDITHIIDKVKLHFHKCTVHETIAVQGGKCNQLIFLLKGEVMVQTTDNLRHFTLTETLKSPCIIEPYSLFGMSPQFTATYRTQTPADLLCVDKTYILGELIHYEVFYINFLNLLSNRAQVCQNKLWNNTPLTTEEKIIHFLRQRCNQPEGEKTLHIKMDDLAVLIDDTRNNVSKALNDMESKKQVRLSRKEIIIHALEAL